MTNRIKLNLATSKLIEYEQLNKIYDDIIKEARPHLTVEGQGKILLTLADEDHLSQRQLATRLGMSPQSVSEFVNKLVKRNMVTLTRSVQDRRVNLISLTDIGRDKVNTANQEVLPFLRTLSNSELDQLSTLLTKIIKIMYKDIDAADPTLAVRFHKLFASKYLRQYKGKER